MDKKNLSPTFQNQGGDTSKRWYITYHDGKKWCKKSVPQKLGAGERTKFAEDFIRSLSVPEKKENKSKNIDQELRELLNTHTIGQRKKGVQTYTTKINVFLAWCKIQKIDTLDRVGEGVVAAFMLYLRTERKLHNTTVEAYRSTLARHIPAFVSKPIKHEKTPCLFFTKIQAKRLVDSFKKENEFLYQFTRILAGCFLRPREICQIQVADVLFELGKIRVRAEVSKNKKLGFALIPDYLLLVFVSLCENKNPEDFLFSNNGKQYNPKKVADKHQALLKYLNFDTTKYKLYSWRHTGAVAAVTAGVNITELKILMRHASEVETAGYLRSLGLDHLSQNLQDKLPDLS